LISIAIFEDQFEESAIEFASQWIHSLCISHSSNSHWCWFIKCKWINCRSGSSCNIIISLIIPRNLVVFSPISNVEIFKSKLNFITSHVKYSIICNSLTNLLSVSSSIRANSSPNWSTVCKWSWKSIICSPWISNFIELDWCFILLLN